MCIKETMVLLPSLARLCLGQPTGMQAEGPVFANGDRVFYRRYGSFAESQPAVVLGLADDGHMVVILYNDGTHAEVDPAKLKRATPELQRAFDTEEAALAAAAEAAAAAKAAEVAAAAAAAEAAEAAEASEAAAAQEEPAQQPGSASTHPIPPVPEKFKLTDNRVDAADYDSDFDNPEDDAKFARDERKAPDWQQKKRAKMLNDDKRNSAANRQLREAWRADARFGLQSAFRTRMAQLMQPLEQLSDDSAQYEKTIAEVRELDAIIYLLEFILEPNNQVWLLDNLKDNWEFVNEWRRLLRSWQATFETVKDVINKTNGYDVIMSNTIRRVLFKEHSRQHPDAQEERKDLNNALVKLKTTLEKLKEKKSRYEA